MWLAQGTGSDAFMPHGMCYLWEPELLWTHVVSDVLIGAAYLVISVTLAWLVWRSARERVDEAGPFERLPFWWMFLAFGLFIVACGVTHFLGAWTVWNPDYWVSGGAKVVTAVASVATAVALPPLVPRALRLVRDARASEARERRLELARRELEQANERIRELDTLKTDFFANVSHELRTPLTLISGPLERRLERDELSDELRRELEGMLRNARTLRKHVDDLLEVSRLDLEGVRPDYREGDLARLVRRAAANFDTLARERSVRLVVDAGEPVRATVDPDQIERVVLNLLSNAFKFTPEGGTVRVVVDERSTGGGADGGPRARLIVADSGPGIPEDMRDAVFERFRQVEGGPARAFAGTGLGLTIVREFVELHGGEVRVGDAPEGGALFEVTLPLVPPADEAAGPGTFDDARSADARAVVEDLRSGASVDRPAAPGGPEGTVAAGAASADAGEVEGADHEAEGHDVRPVVLVVEDNAELGRFLLDILPSDVRGVLGRDGHEGLRLAREHRPDVILSDIMMPGMSGGELLDAVREVPGLERVPFLALTARAERKERLALLAGGAQDYITKPFTPAEVSLRVGIWLSVARTRRLLQSELEERGADLESLAGDLTRRKRELEVALEAARVAREEEAMASRAKSEFLAVISHELRTPLTAIMGYVDLMLEEITGPVSPKQRNQLERIRRSSDHLLELIEQILDFSRLERDELEPRLGEVDLRAVAAELEPVIRPMAEEKGLRFSVRRSGDGALRTDPGRLRQILLNLLTNAVKYTEEGSVELEMEDRDDRVVFRVADTGIGIAPEHRSKIFEPFWQVDQSETRGAGGTGLGLSIARRLTRRLGGDLTVRPREGGGTVFEVSLPRRFEGPADLSSGEGV